MNTNQINTVAITNESGEIIWSKNFITELLAQNYFDTISTIKSPLTFEKFTMNCSEFFTGGNIGSLKLIVENQHGYLIRRELFRNA